MTLGTLVSPNRINIVFALVLTPLLFTGSTQFPWPSLERLRWFQVVCALNPLTYVSEALRAAMAPDGAAHRRCGSARWRCRVPRSSSASRA